MSESDRLRHAMRVTERPGPALDLAAVMRDGRRLRTRRRVVGVGAATVVVGLAVVVAVVTVDGRPGAPPPVAIAPAPPAVSPTFPGTPAPTASREKSPPAAGRDTLPPTTAGETASPVGAVVDSGVRHGVDERVFYVVRVTVPGQPRVSIGLAAGRRAPDGTVTTDILVNDVEGNDRSPGFHQIGYDESGSAASVPTFGYFVGPAHQIIGTVDGRKVSARLSPWSADKKVVIFWFDPAELRPGDRLDGIIAHDSAGRRL